jgi:hypothetical protein
VLGDLAGAQGGEDPLAAAAGGQVGEVLGADVEVQVSARSDARVETGDGFVGIVDLAQDPPDGVSQDTVAQRGQASRVAERIEDHPITQRNQIVSSRVGQAARIARKVG